jgi:hypothetical protein
MTDCEFVEAVEHGRVEEFGHREHLRLAFALVRELGLDAALVRARAILRHLAAAHGQPERFHVTLTDAWVRAVAHHLEVDPAVAGFDGLLERFPQLLRQDLLGAHYSPGLLWSQAARVHSLPPDRLPIPT